MGVAAPAAAATLFADPAGSGSGTCEPPDPPCTLQRAVEVEAGDGDEVIVNPGTYNEGSNEVTILDAINLHGAAGASPVIVSNSALEAVEGTLPGIRVANLVIEYSGGGTGVRLTNGASGERLYVKSGGTVGCTMFQGTLNDSVCWSGGASGNGIFSSVSASTSITTTLRNVTAVASGTSSRGMDFTSAGGLTHVVDAKNVIADGVEFDIRAQAGASSTTAINLAHSNYVTTDAGGAGTATTTPAGSGTNQTAAPLFANAANGDFHEAAGSPTIDAGTGDSQLGSADIDGEARSQGAVPDIGADEFVPTLPPAANGDRFPPDTKILKGPKKRTKKRKAKFQFGGSEPGLTFECSLDEKAFKPCHSPKKFRSLKRTKHVFAVRAVDAAGNRDPTPADRKWSIKKKKRRK